MPSTSEGNELLAPWRTSPYIMDFNQDGLKDLVMLDYQGYLAVYPRYLDENDALQGAKDIIAEKINEDAKTPALWPPVAAA